MSSNEKNVKLRTDRVLILVIGLVLLVTLIVLLVRVSSKDKAESTGANVQNNDNSIAQVETPTTDDTSSDTVSDILADGNDTEVLETSEDTSTEEDTFTPPTEHTVEEIDGCTYIDGILIINKSYSVSPDYQGYNGGYDDTKPTPPQGLFPEVIEAFNQLQEDSASEGLDIYIASGYRSYYYQQNVYNRYCEYDSPEVVDTYSARAGYSEHQSGYAFDLNSIDDSFADTPEGQWIAENCYKYGFVIRFPEGKEDITGYQYESWHLRYVGVDVATYMYENNLCLEEYLGVDSVYAD
jgi:D-alanyl-D-alanine carboxypeptidase